MRLAVFAERAAGDPSSSDYLYLRGLTCWISVVEAARMAGSISQAQATAIKTEITQEHWSPFVPLDSRIAFTRKQFTEIPLGGFLAFLKPAYPGQTNAEEGVILSHAMVYLGGGRAAGSNNFCIGGRPDWSVMDLATLPWASNARNCDHSFEYDGVRFVVRYRAIDEIQKIGGVII